MSVLEPPDDVQERITDFWSIVAPGYEAHPGNVPKRDSAEYEAWVQAIRDLLPPAPADVLDLATGTGFVAVIAARLGYRVVALDASAAMLEQARRNASAERVDVMFAQGDAVAPEPRANSFDAITCRHLLWTLREPERAFANWLALLRPGGRVIAIDGFWFNQPSPDDEPSASDDAGDEAAGIFEQHYTPETRAALPGMQATTAEPFVEMFRAAGFEDVAVSQLTKVHELAEDPPSSEPWYVIVAHRPT